MIPTIDYLSTSPSRTPAELPGVERLDGKVEVTYKISGVVPDTFLWLETLAGDRLSWLRAFVTFPTFVQGGSFVDSPIRRLLAPRIRQTVVITKSAGGVPSSATVYGAARSYGVHKSTFKVLEINYNAEAQSLSTWRCTKTVKMFPFRLYCKGADSVIYTRLRAHHDSLLMNQLSHSNQKPQLTYVVHIP